MRTMDDNDLTAALAGTPKPGREDVLGSFQRKHRRKKAERRLIWASGATACAVAAVTVVSMVQPWSKGSSMVPDSAACGPVHMTQAFAQAKNAGASILIADAVPAARNGASGYTAVLLRSVQTLSGPAIAPGTIAWSHEKAAGTSGKFFAVVWPKRAGTVGPIIRTAPVVGDNVIFSSYGCRDAASVPTPTSSGQPLGSPAGLDGAFAISLRTVEAAAVGSLSDGQDDHSQPTPSAPAPSASRDSSAPRASASASGNQNADNSQGSGNTPSANPSQGNPANGNSQGGTGQGSGNGQGRSPKSSANNGNGQH